jgi:3-isopropylmalate dehydrogenase
MQALICVLPGDGIGPEVVAAAVEVLARIARRSGHVFHFEEAPIGGAAIDRRGTALPPETLALARRADAVLLGAVGGPRWDDARERPEAGLLAIRKELGLFANVRPVAPHPALAQHSPLRPEVLRGADLVIVRELTGGLYFGARGQERGSAFDSCVYTEAEVARVADVAFALARKRRSRVTSIDKANVLATSRLWREVVTRLQRGAYPDVTLDHELVDAAAMHLVRRPADYDVIVTENMFGDILSDEAAVLAGSIGLLPSASIGEGRSGLYEPIHGSAPDIAGRGIANPCGAIASAAMLLRHSLGLDAEAAAVERAVGHALAEGPLTPDLGGTATTRSIADAVLARLV